MTKDFETLLFAVEDGVATITLNRPDRMNAFTPQMATDLIAAFDITDAEDAVKAVIVTGAGERAFCAGADLGAGGNTFDYNGYDGAEALPQANGVYRDIGGLVTLRIFDSLKPVIAAVNGASAGVGASMQLAMDIRIASTSARFGFVFARRGIAPDAAASWFLPRIVGIGTALAWTCSGRVLPAEEALARGLVQSLHAPDELMAAAQAIAREIVDHCAPVSVAVTRRLMWDMLGAAHPMDAHRADSRAIQARGLSADVKEGVTAFLEKRAPTYPDRVSDGLPDMYPGRSVPSFY
ncbi:crotonase/enoyl-CoA hydratase family protein [Sphingopyxis sp. 550A]